MDKQQIFDTGVAGIIAQGKPAMGSQGFCAYRTDDGCKCFLGLLIPDNRYSPELERLGPDDADLTRAMGLGDPNEDMSIFLDDCQSAHDDAAAQNVGDNAAFLADFRERAVKLAGWWGLNPAVADVPAPAA